MIFTIQYIHTNQQQKRAETEEYGKGNLSGIMMIYAVEAESYSLTALV